MSLQINNVVSILDNGEFVTLVTESGSSIHMPMKSEHSITIFDMECPSDDHVVNVSIDLYEGC